MRNAVFLLLSLAGTTLITGIIAYITWRRERKSCVTQPDSASSVAMYCKWFVANRGM